MNPTRALASLTASLLLLGGLTSCYYDSHYYDYDSVYDDGYYGGSGYYNDGYSSNVYYPRSIGGGYYGSPFFRNYTTYYHNVGGVRCPYYLYNGRRYYHKSDHHRRFGNRVYKDDRNRRDRYDRGPKVRDQRPSSRNGSYITNSGRAYNRLSGNETKYVPNRTTNSTRASSRVAPGASSRASIRQSTDANRRNSIQRSSSSQQRTTARPMPTRTRTTTAAPTRRTTSPTASRSSNSRSSSAPQPSRAPSVSRSSSPPPEASSSSRSSSSSSNNGRVRSAPTRSSNSDSGRSSERRGLR